nr:cytochrome P450 CYP72A219-like [Ipomoea batatas]
MEDLICKAVGLCGVVLVSLCGLAIFHFVWWRPKRVEMKLRQQGLRGTSYRFLYGDMVDMNKLRAQSWSKPMALHHAIAQRVNPFIFNMVQTHGRISLSWNQRRARLTVADAKLIRQILEDKHGNFRKPPQNPLIDLLTMGVSNLEGQVWSNRRKHITPAFHHDKLQGMVPAFLSSCSSLVNKWKELMGSQECYELDVMPQMQIFSSDVIARAAFGSSYEQGKRIFELQKEQVVLVIEAAQSLYLPGFSYLPTKKNKRRYEIDSEIKSLLRGMIEQKQMAIQDGKMDGEDLLSLLLQCKDEAGRELPIEDVIEECKLFYFAGQETTANWLTWTLIVLSMHPNWQDKAREEVLKICGNKTPALQSLNQLKVVSMILNEVLRLYPPVTTLFRYTLKTTNIGNICVPPGVELHLPVILLHHDTDYWGDDADEFNPERFRRGVSNAAAAAKQEVAFYTSGWGPRYCLGQSFAVMEAKLALAMILQNFWFELSPSYAHAPHTIITLQPQYGAPLLLHRI